MAPNTSTSVENNIGPSSSTNMLGVDYYNYQDFEVMNDMISDVVGVNLSFNEDQYDDTDGLPNEEAHRFYSLLKETHKLWLTNDNQTAFETTHGMLFWDYAERESKINNLFNDAMASDARLVSSVVIEKCKEVFNGLESLVDVGGGTGTMAKALAKSFPQLECTVFDLPHVVVGLQGTDNLKYVGGDMFKEIPPADAILLKWILHDWNDEECVKIFKNVRNHL
uniref:Probable O-methyltransferase 3 n=1 Tax=Cicer arietinum TaxID=3827 RepID=A0A3Q7Y8G2_CICAR|nr:probable O-methyltransferase 3 [Cicer arietinum]